MYDNKHALGFFFFQAARKVLYKTVRVFNTPPTELGSSKFRSLFFFARIDTRTPHLPRGLLFFFLPSFYFVQQLGDSAGAGQWGPTSEDTRTCQNNRYAGARHKRASRNRKRYALEYNEQSGVVYMSSLLRHLLYCFFLRGPIDNDSNDGGVSAWHTKHRSMINNEERNMKYEVGYVGYGLG